MTRDKAKKLLPVIQAYADGKDVEWRREDGTWGILREPIFGADVDRYRIKPEPFECWIALDKDEFPWFGKTEEEAKEKAGRPIYGPYTIHHMREVI